MAIDRGPIIGPYYKAQSLPAQKVHIREVTAIPQINLRTTSRAYRAEVCYLYKESMEWTGLTLKISAGVAADAESISG